MRDAAEPEDRENGEESSETDHGEQQRTGGHVGEGAEDQRGRGRGELSSALREGTGHAAILRPILQRVSMLCAKGDHLSLSLSLSSV